MGPRCAFRTFIRNHDGRVTCTSTCTTSRRPNKLCGPLLVCNNINLNGARLVRTVTGGVLRRGPGTGVGCIADRAFAGSCVGSVGGGGRRRFQHRCHSLSTLLISSIRFFSGGRNARLRFFGAFGSLRSGGGRVILATSQGPGRVPSLASQLISHFI